MIGQLINYAIDKNYIEENDRSYIGNKILNIVGENEHNFFSNETNNDIIYILNKLLDIACENGKIENTITQRDLLDTKIMGEITPLPSIVIKKFQELYKNNKEDATNYFYNLSKDIYYIRTDRIEKNIMWESHGLDITINLSKPEKNPKDIAKAKNTPKNKYPKCLLCRENEGFAGNLNHPARQNLRLIPLSLCNENWFLQYSPYSYFNEHSILLNEKHIPMVINKRTFDALLSFVDYIPHYFAGSNADLPIVGGSILSHDHYQCGNHIFPMDKANSFHKVTKNNITLELLQWPLSTIRLCGENKNEILALGEKILNQWIDYSDPEHDIVAHTTERHNTITPIARKKGNQYILNLVLRNNRTSKEHPDGIFHPHKEIHHIKKENIGLIEVMGLAILPARLKDELKNIEYVLLNKKEISEELLNHKNWIEYLKTNYNEKDNLIEYLKNEVGKKFMECLTHCGVFKLNEHGKNGFIKFLNTI
ncbi:MAG: UDP-glucose--hexose-1-phosphate uridylyltransferase [Lachnospirales bacterium]